MISGYDDVRNLVLLVEEMKEAGLSETDMRSYMGGNFLRVPGACIG